MHGTVSVHEDGKRVKNAEIQKYEDIDLIVQLIDVRSEYSYEAYQAYHGNLLNSIMLVDIYGKTVRDKDDKSEKDKHTTEESSSWFVKPLKSV